MHPCKHTFDACRYMYIVYIYIHIYYIYIYLDANASCLHRPYTCTQIGNHIGLSKNTSDKTLSSVQDSHGFSLPFLQGLADTLKPMASTRHVLDSHLLDKLATITCWAINSRGRQLETLSWYLDYHHISTALGSIKSCCRDIQFVNVPRELTGSTMEKSIDIPTIGCESWDAYVYIYI